jgi:hypothetical protein
MKREIVHIEKYPYIRVWGEYLGSFSYYIEAQKAEAERDNAPGTALYKGEDGTWVLVENVSEALRRRLARML